MTDRVVDFGACEERLQAEVAKVIYGMGELVRNTLIAYMVGGHVLVEGPPGVAKTLLARTMARALGLDMGRLQCTPDLMPGDVLGTNIFDFKSQSFRLTKGPVFTEFLLADEINRTPPKTQAALLEAMQERTVSIDGRTHALSPRFTVMATQNPLEHEGTYPLPEAQLDRFLFKLLVPYPEEEQEVGAVTAHCGGATMPDLDELGVTPVFTAAELEALRRAPARTRIEEDLVRYAVTLARATREEGALMIGLSPRAATMLAASGRAVAALEGRDFAVPDDLKGLFMDLARHRVILSPGEEIEGVTEEEVLGEILESVDPPR